jgi:two-component system, cell cycle response regulator
MPRASMPPRAVRVLVVEDNPADADLVRIALDERAPGEFTVVHVRNLRAALEHLVRNDTELVLLDLGLPDAEGLHALERVRAARAAVPIVVLTGRADRTVGLAALERGAQAYVLKGWEDPSDLVGTVRGALGRRRALQDLAAVGRSLRSAEERLKKIGPEPRSKKE